VTPARIMPQPRLLASVGTAPCQPLAPQHPAHPSVARQPGLNDTSAVGLMLEGPQPAAQQSEFRTAQQQQQAGNPGPASVSAGGPETASTARPTVRIRLRAPGRLGGSARPSAPSIAAAEIPTTAAAAALLSLPGTMSALRDAQHTLTQTGPTLEEVLQGNWPNPQQIATLVR
jgi:hypothetical protein